MSVITRLLQLLELALKAVRIVESVVTIVMRVRQTAIARRVNDRLNQL